MKFRLIFITLFITAVSFSQNKGAITGILTDKEANNQSLPFANVLIKETSNGANTDIDGNYSVTGIPAGKYKVRIDCISYLTVVVSDLSVTAGSNTFDIMLEENVLK